MLGIEQRSVCEGVNFRSVKDTRFKTVRMSVNFLLPIQKQTAASNAILPFLLSRASREYPDFTKLGQRLAKLYGAELNADVQKLGDAQLLSLSAAGIADRYALHGEHIAAELSKLLCSIIFDPPFEDGLFPKEGFEQERRQTIELIDSEFNDKRIYARQRCEEIMCGDEPYGIKRYGSREDIQNLKREELTEAWRFLINNAKTEIMVLGDCDPAPVYEGFCEAFQKLNKKAAVDCPTKIRKQADQVKNVTDKMDIAQSKLVMGFRTQTAIPDERVEATTLMTALYGGTPNSKLFLNVREKLSLCYYCSSLYNAMKGIMLVQSGVETKNIEKAREEILTQLDKIKKGEFDDGEIDAAKLSMSNSYHTLSDSLGGLEAWYLSQTFSNQIKRPEEAAAIINSVTRQEIIDAANRVTLDTVYRLEGNGEEQI
ncbi:EF-P 5-aminopentanol modification-associated protein YfmF [Caproiciproducens galactitolivorans]|uniref:Insulinase family protein n=1 Tax=Caproiciproducens galactitolivorans TaxID=642589 RepID=A0ABT4BQT3_9FIRM|nr:insulinase family protein [Caproiciproducens galactitolivorans]MCY1713232.1 insulinase family protein [Caproiciproducens galactitolivorans]